MKRLRICSSTVVSICLILTMICLVPYSLAADSNPNWKPPELMVIAGPTSTVAGFVAGSALLGTISEKTGVQFRIIPKSKSIQRYVTMESGESLCVISSGGFTNQYNFGLYEFDKPNLGPRPARALYLCGVNIAGFPTRADSGIKTVADLKGKRVAYIQGRAGQQANNEAMLAFAGLTYDDCIKVPVGGYNQAVSAILEGKVDTCYCSAGNKNALELAASNHGLRWLPLPASNTEGWKRFWDICKAWFPYKMRYPTEGLKKGETVEAMGSPYYILMRDENVMSNELAFWFTKHIYELYPEYKDKHAFLATWTPEQALNGDMMMIPYHQGCINYFKSIGKWTDKLEQRQQELLAQQEMALKNFQAKYPAK